MKEKIVQLKELIETSEKILLINHIRMDGDAFGSISALHMLLKKLGKEVRSTNDEKVPEAFAFLGKSEIIEPKLPLLAKDGNEGWDPDLIIGLDTSSENRFGETYQDNKKIFQEKDFVVIDHHATNELLGSINIVEQSYSSTAELLFKIIKEMGYLEYVDKEIATSLLMGINTDTNIFYNTNTSTRTFRYATELFELGGDQRTIVFELFKKKKFSKSKLWGESLSIAKSHEGGKIVGSIITHEMYEKTSTSEEDTSGLINEFFTNIEGAKVAYLLSEAGNGVKCSMRSFDAKHNVSEIAKKFGGGGHIQAAGFYIEGGSIETLEKRLVEALKKIVNIDK